MQFLCPKCFEGSGRTSRGVHSIVCWRPRVPAGVSPAPGRWELEGTGFEDLSLVARMSSVHLQGGCNAHFHVERGAIRFV